MNEAVCTRCNAALVVDGTGALVDFRYGDPECGAFIGHSTTGMYTPRHAVTVEARDLEDARYRVHHYASPAPEGHEIVWPGNGETYCLACDF